MGKIMTKLDLKFVHKTTNRHGKTFYSFRKKGSPRVRLLGDVGSVAFMAAYGQCLNSSPALPTGPLKVKQGSMAALTHAWYASGEFKQLRATTQVTYRGIMERFLAAHGEKPVDRLERKIVSKLIADKASTPAAANGLLARLKQIMRFALENEWIKVDPTFGVKKLKYRVKGFESWTESDAAQFVAFHKQGSMGHLAFMILSSTGVRRSDAVKLGRGNRRGDTVVVDQTKTGEKVVIPLHENLMIELDNIKDRMIYLRTSFGKPFTAAGFGNWMRDQCNLAGLPVCTAHGLRKLAATRLAEAGCSENEISAILGWANNRQASLYTKAANKEKMARAAMKAVTEAERIKNGKVYTL